MANRTNQIKSVEFADVGGSNAMDIPAHFFDAIEITPAHPANDTYFKTKYRSGFRSNLAFTLRRGALARINTITEVFVGKPHSSGAYQASADDPTTTPAEWFSAGGMVQEAAGLNIPAPESSLSTDMMPLLTAFMADGTVGLKDLTSAQATLLDARDNGPTDLAFKRPDGTYLILKEVYVQSQLDPNTNAGGYLTRGLSFQRGRTRNLENFIEGLAGDTYWDWFNDRQLVSTRVQVTIKHIDDGTETVKTSPYGFTARPIINLTGESFDALRIEGVGYSNASSLITLSPSLS